MKAIVAFVAGILFGLGLLISGMTNPANVLGFLDITGDWKPALAFTMAGAIAAAAPAFFYVRKHRRTLLGDPVELPERNRVDGRLLIGAAVFGVGWGMSGICPAPGLLLLTSLRSQPLLFGVSVIIGMLAVGASDRALTSLRARRQRCAPGNPSPGNRETSRI